MTDVEQVEREMENCSIFDESAINTSKNRWCNLTMRIVFSTPGLVCLVVVYSVIGALIFPLLETKEIHGGSTSIVKSREDCLKELWTITERLNVLYERNWTLLVHEQLRRFEGSIVAATRAGGFAESDGNHFSNGWTFNEALLYSVTVITTIGHGNLTPRTTEGKIVTMFYAVIGVPLMLMCLSSLGGILADALQCVYCRLCRKTACKSVEKLALTSCNQLGQNPDQSGDNSQFPGNHRNEEMNCGRYDLVIPHTNPNTNNNNNVNHHINNLGKGVHFQGAPINAEDDNNYLNNSPNQLNAVQFRSQYNNFTNYNVPNQSIFQHNTIRLHDPNILIESTGNNTHGTLKRIFFAEQPADPKTIHQQPLQDFRIPPITAGIKSIFIPKPLPQEINVLIAESEMECAQNVHVDGSSLSLEEEEDEDNRSCAHDTPSRMPLIARKGSPPSSNQYTPHKVSFSEDKSVFLKDNHQQYRSDVERCQEQQTLVDQDQDLEGNRSEWSAENYNTQVPITLIFFILVCYISMGTVIFSMWENWSVVDGAYFCFVTLSTIGFGDLYPSRTFRGPELQLFACFAYLLLGLVLVAMTFTVVENQLMCKCRRVAIKLRLGHKEGH